MVAILAFMFAIGDGKPGKADTSAKQGNMARLPLTVTILPEKTVVCSDEELRVTFRVVNQSAKPVTFEVFNKATYWHWRADNPQVAVIPWVANRNFYVPVTLKPGQAYDKWVNVSVKETGDKAVSFRLEFTPRHAARESYWSNEVALEIARAPIITILPTLIREDKTSGPGPSSGGPGSWGSGIR